MDSDRINRWLKEELLGRKRRSRIPREVLIAQWLGISVDESHRAKLSRDAWISIEWPLIDPLRMTRRDCLRWNEQHGFPEPPRSACIGCPFHSDAEWRHMKRDRLD